MQNTTRTMNGSRSLRRCPASESASCSRSTSLAASMLAAPWSRNVRRCSPRMNPNDSTCAGRSASGKAAISRVSKSRSSKVRKSLTRMKHGRSRFFNASKYSPACSCALRRSRPVLFCSTSSTLGQDQVDEARAVVELRNVHFVSRDVPTSHPIHVEKSVVEALRLALLVGPVLPVFSKDSRAGPNLVQRRAHGLQRFLIETVFVNPPDVMEGACAHADIRAGPSDEPGLRTIDEDMIRFGLRATWSDAANS